ncbi:hypothetical protein AVEN_111012-1, partial [Araneus ventricosus]
ATAWATASFRIDHLTCKHLSPRFIHQTISAAANETYEQDNEPVRKLVHLCPHMDKITPTSSRQVPLALGKIVAGRTARTEFRLCRTHMDVDGR